MTKRQWVLLAQIFYGIMWRTIILTFAFIGFTDWFFTVLG